MSAVIELDGMQYGINEEGFLLNRLQWNPELARAIGQRDEVQLTDEHFEVIHYFREYYENYNVPPPMRMVIRVFKKAFGDENANSRYLQSLFPQGVIKQASKFAGLPKPKNCK